MSDRSTSSSSTSRRDFIKSSAVVASGAIAGSLSVAQSAHAAGDDEIKIALIGCGSRGSKATLQALQTEGRVKLIAMADAFRDRLDDSLGTLTKSDRVDVPEDRRFVGFDAYKQAIAADPDVVILATPPGFRPIHFEAAVAANKHVFMEKPVAVDAPGVRRVLAAAEESKRKNLAVGVELQRHHQMNYLETRKRVEDGQIGDVHFMRVYWNSSGVWVRSREDVLLQKLSSEHGITKEALADPDRKEQILRQYASTLTEMEYQMRNWYYFNWLCGDHIVEQHIHNLDVGNWFKGATPVEAIGMGGREIRNGKDHGEIFDHHFVEFTYADGTKMMSQCRHMPNCWSSVSEHIHGTKGTAQLDHRGRITGAEPWRYKGPNPNPYQVEHDDLFASIRSGNPINEAEYGATSTMTSILGRMATYSGKKVTWDQSINSEISLAPKEYDFAATAPVRPDENGFYPVAVPGITEVV